MGAARSLPAQGLCIPAGAFIHILLGPSFMKEVQCAKKESFWKGASFAPAQPGPPFTWGASFAKEGPEQGMNGDNGWCTREAPATSVQRQQHERRQWPVQ